MKDEIIIRTYIIFLGFLLVSFLILGRAIQIGVLEGDKWRSRGDSLYVRHQPVDAERGNILSSDGRMLVTSLPLFDVRMDLISPDKDKFVKHLDSLSLYLTRYINPAISERAYRDLLWRERLAGNRYLLIKEDVSYAQLERIKTFPLFRLGSNKGGLIVVKKSRRERPFRMLASRTLGTVREGAKPVGLEGYYDDVLAGQKGSRLVQKVARDIWIPIDDIGDFEPKRGNDIVTNIDIDIQDIAEQALYNAITHHAAEAGTVVVMDVKTGAVKAMANLSRSGDDIGEYYNFAVGAATEPGSTFKLATMMALMEDGYIKLNDQVDILGGQVALCSKKIHDSKEHGLRNVTLKKAFSISSNVGIALTAQKYYAKNPKKFIERLTQFGLAKRSGIDLEGEPAPFIKKANDKEQGWSCTSIPWMSHGYELTITPLQLLTFYNAVANNGQRMQPQLVNKVLEYSDPVKTFDPIESGNKICSASSLAFAKEILVSTTDSGGTAESLRNPMYKIAGKTGTAVTNYYKGDIAQGKKYQASFAGFFPADNPVYSCIVVIYEPKQYGFYGSSAALPVFKEIANYCLASKFILPVELVQENEKFASPSTISGGGYATDLRTILHHSGISFKNNCMSEWAKLESTNQTIELNTDNSQTALIPDVRGMGLRDALFLLENRGVKVRFQGQGRVKQQSITPGTRALGQTIDLTMG